MPSAKDTMPDALQRFVDESWRIEGLYSSPSDVAAHRRFFARDLSVESIEQFVFDVVKPPLNLLRSKPNMNVVVGNHRPPKGGPMIRGDLEKVLQIECPFKQHLEYENLHPFMDGNGRSGRALYLLRVGDLRGLSFLHHWYYKSLQYDRDRHKPNV